METTSTKDPFDFTHPVSEESKAAFERVDKRRREAFCSVCGGLGLWTNGAGNQVTCPKCKGGGFQQDRVAAYSDASKEVESLHAKVSQLEQERDALVRLIDTPHTAEFLSSVKTEAAHQVKRWGTEHDVGKTPWDWFWLVGYLAQKAASSALLGDTEKAKHHTISTAAVMLNWFRRLTGDDLTFQPGVDPTKRGAEAALATDPLDSEGTVQPSPKQ